MNESLRVTLIAAFAATLCGCAATAVTTAGGDAATAGASAPQYRIGDRWVYRVRDGFGVPRIYEETYAVTAVGPEGATVAVTVTGPGPTVNRVERWHDGRMLQGALFDIETRRFATPLVRYDFPLQPGKRWNQHVDNYNELTMREGRINRYVRVGGHERVVTPAGTYDTVRLNVIMRLDDGEFWRWPTDASYTVWYAPAAKAAVREVRRADYLERGGHDSIARHPAQYAIVELVSFTPGG